MCAGRSDIDVVGHPVDHAAGGAIHLLEHLVFDAEVIALIERGAVAREVIALIRVVIDEIGVTGKKVARIDSDRPGVGEKLQVDPIVVDAAADEVVVVQRATAAAVEANADVVVEDVIAADGSGAAVDVDPDVAI